MLLGHLTIVVVSFALGLWFLPLVTTFAPYYGGILHTLCNSSQHVGLRDNVPDFRLCCRTIYLNPFFQFLYWHMNYHTEHHMYAAVPCYNLPKLHRLIRAEMPHCPSGLYETWKGIAAILKRQKDEPSYQFTAELPPKPGERSAPITVAVEPSTIARKPDDQDAEAVLGVMAAEPALPVGHG